MATCNLTVDLVSTPGALVTVTYDRDVRTTTGVTPAGVATVQAASSQMVTLAQQLATENTQTAN